ncbi:uncharacterized protein LOC126759743 [Bactrocera neohumeralis]|uniref:uncharacterized protein LOC126759743 n=1 Tax=Bactrocera neohumeralis TaxID=98809 RepID=UPI002166457A|nr:uncharacterized protein LOC126759743 [Bactrocera neohumeralis]
MNLPDGKQLVRESSGKLEEPLCSKRKMGLHAKLAWIALFFCLGLIALAHCIPVEVIYTGEGCDCPSKLDFSVNVPRVAKPKKCHTPYEYGYKVEVPRQTKAKVSYSIDFSVEEPRPPKPTKPSKLNLYATVDRVAINKGDCEDSYAASSAPSTCRCGQCGISQPSYRYVFNDMATPSLPCKCRRPNCKCNLCRAQSTPFSPNAIFMGKPFSDLMSAPMPLANGGGEGDDGYVNNGGGGAEVGAVNIRRKRDLHRTLFGSRKATKERPSRFVKLYHKNLSETPRRLFDFEERSNRQQRRQQQSTPKKPKRKAKKPRYTHQQRSRLVKRDIKGEYELLEKEREQMDLTLPEIIQFMPETLQPDFKRGQCYFGCGIQHSQQTKSTENNPNTNTKTDNNPNSSTEYSMLSHEINTDHPDVTITYTDTNTSKGDTTGMNMDMDANGETDAESTRLKQSEKETMVEESLLKETNDSTAENSISSSYKKRNAANYYSGRSTSTPESAYPECEMCLSALQKKRAYRAHSPTTQPISTNPNYKPPQQSYPKTVNSAAPQHSKPTYKLPTTAQRYIYDYLGRNYLENNGELHGKTTIISVPDPLDHNATPLRYAGDLEAPPQTYSGQPYGAPPSTHAKNYPVQHITDQQLDKIITDIIYSHPEFIDATKHYGGALVDPEPWQEQETISFFKKLIDGRLSLWFDQEDTSNPQQHSTSYNSNVHNYAIPQLHDLLPPLLY